MARVEIFNPSADRVGITDFHPIPVERIGNAECVGGKRARKCENRVHIESSQRALAVFMKRFTPRGGSHVFHLHRNVFQHRMDLRIESLGNHPYFMAYFCQFPAEVGGIAFCAAFAVRAFLADDGDFHVNRVVRRAMRRICGRHRG